jgi:sirohydrochlorin cobaltochelatase
MKNGLILFAHGARDPRWALPFEAVARRVAGTRPDALVRLAFLEFMTPDLAAAGDELAAAGCNTVEIVPLFLGAGGHVRRDLPLLLDALRSAHPQARWTLHPATGEQDSVVAAMADAAVATLPPAATVAAR